ncbi:hypothetical protein PRIPAC_76529 [Pristionchus pacificus]|uniref:PHD finger motif containing protein n=1 Tax=Pristionchus pacificus TaxID=54126 RepID=A0A2A6C050_PRIPA|nr:hypothetical protein PRIPAC_76529 [Pristionchus pacificus]|eukprot:PDM71401.1 PHD finger motif containing protein [Pristionchus pacificus]
MRREINQPEAAITNDNKTLNWAGTKSEERYRTNDAYSIGSVNRVHPSPTMADKRKPPGIKADKSSSSGSEESQDASTSAASFSDRAKASASEIPKTTNKLCIICHDDAAASSPNPMLTCATCTLTTHAKCAKPPVEKEEFSSPRFSYTCTACTRRPRSESPKPSAARHHSAILLTAPHDGRRKKTVEGKVKGMGIRH